MFKVKIGSREYYDFLGKLGFIIILLGFTIVFSAHLINAIGWFVKGPSLFTYCNATVSTLIVALSCLSIYIVAMGRFNQAIFFTIFGLVLIYEIIAQTIVKRIDIFIITILQLSFYLFFIWLGVNNFKNEKKPKILSKKQAKQ